MGKNKYIESPEKLWELFTAYKKQVKETPYLRHKVVTNKDGLLNAYEEVEQPLTMEGFECYVMDHTRISYPDLSEYFDGKNPSYSDYFHISSRIAREIRSDQVRGGLIGNYNANITARLNSLEDRKTIGVETKLPPWMENESQS